MTNENNNELTTGPENVPVVNTKEQVENLTKINSYRMHMLRGQVEWDFRLGKPTQSGKRLKPTVRNNNRVFFDALDIMEGKKAFRSINEDERRAAATLVEYFNSLMLKIVAEKAKEQETANNPIENKGE